MNRIVNYVIVLVAVGAALPLCACGAKRAEAVRLDVLGTNALLSGDTETALQALRDATQKDATYTDARVNLAVAQRMAGHVDLAVANCQAVLAKEGEPQGLAQRFPLLAKIVTHSRPVHDETARLILTQVLHDQGLNRLAWGEWTQAQEIFASAIVLFDTSAQQFEDFRNHYRGLYADLHMGLGQAYAHPAASRPQEASELYPQARRSFEQAIEANPDLLQAYLYCGDACLAGEPSDGEAAYKYYNGYVKRGGTDPRAVQFIKEKEQE